MKNINDFMDNDVSKLTLDTSSIIIINKKFLNFETDLFEIDIFKNYGFNISIIFSLDNQNWSLPKTISDFDDEIKYYKNLYQVNNELFYCYVKIFVKLIDNSNNSYNQFNKNINEYFPEIIFNDIKYDNKSLLKNDIILIEHYSEVIKNFPNWNLYDNQQIVIERWLSECVAVNNRLGHQCIYFKTKPTEIENTLSTINKREVITIKKLIFSSPENELPTDRNIYSEWDIPMIDDFIIHIPDLLFKLIFGNEIPAQKDFLYIPILNKLYTINAVQPGQKYMGVTGWWECYLIKYEDDENVNKNFNDNEKNALDSLKSVMDIIPNLKDETISEIYEKFENILDNGLETSEKILEKTIEEKKEITENFNNKLVDSTSYISLKETELQRKFYNKRLNIISINPDSLSFPLNMYDLSKIDIKKIGLVYDLKDATKINNFSRFLTNNDNFLISFNFVLLKRFNSDIIDILNNNTILFTIKIKGKNLIILKDNKEYIINYKFEENYFYQINITQNKIIFFILDNNNKKIIHIYDYQLINDNDNFEFTSINLYGGNYYLGQFILKINNNKIIEDKTLPVLNMNSFGI